MTWPLIILAVFALIGGFVGVPEDFPLLGPLFANNPFHHFIGEVVEAIGIHLPIHEMAWGPVGVSVLVALGGLFLGWLIYGRKPLAAGQVDPLKRWLGPVHVMLEKKYYVDELYRAVFIQPAVVIAQKVYAWLDRGLIDGILHTVARAVFGISQGNRWFDRNVVDRTVNLMGKGVGQLGKSFRSLQTGRVQNYILVTAVSVVVFVAFYLILF
jgi:NADH-quinone oxidoreductase subunit L